MANFCKNEDCPTSAELLAFQTGDMPVSEGSGIRKHLTACEFCAAEVDFYSHYPQAEEGVESIEPSQMPRPLFELAEALLNKKQDDTFFNKLLDEDEDFTFSRC